MKILLTLVVLVVIGLVGYNYLAGKQTPEAPGTATQTTSSDSVPAPVSEEKSPVSPEPQTVDTPQVGTDVGMELPVADTVISEEGTLDIAPTKPVVVAKVFDVKGVNYGYDVQEIRVKKGDTVTINFTSTSGFHDWVVDEFDARTEKVQAGGTTSVTFVASKVGTFEYYCSVGSHRQMGMVGKLIVE
jgi:plastocyanin